MMNKLSENDRKLLVRLNEVLHYLWDPICVSEEPSARDEYDSYTLQVFSLLKNKSSCEEIANHLTQITTDHMEVSQRIDHDMRIANILISWLNLYEEKN